MAVLNRKNMDFLSASKRKKRRAAKENAWILTLILIPVVLAGSFIHNFLVHTTDANNMIKQTKEIRDYLKQDNVRQKQAELENLQIDIAALDAYHSNMEIVSQMMSMNIDLDQTTIGQVLDARQKRISLENVFYSEGNLIFTVQAEHYGEIEAFVQRLEKIPRFSHIGYAGFDNSGWNYSVEQPFVADIACTLQN